VTWPAIAEHLDYIVAHLKAGVRMSTIHQRLRDEHGLVASAPSLRRYVAANVPEETRRRFSCTHATAVDSPKRAR